MMSMIFTLFLLIFASIQDIKHRKISNFIPLALFANAVFAVCISEIMLFDIILGALAAFVSLMLVCKSLGGGDIKLLTALGANIGTVNSFAVTMLALLLATAYSKLKKQKSIPLAPFVLASYILLILWRFLFNVWV